MFKTDKSTEAESRLVVAEAGRAERHWEAVVRAQLPFLGGVTALNQNRSWYDGNGHITGRVLETIWLPVFNEQIVWDCELELKLCEKEELPPAPNFQVNSAFLGGWVTWSMSPLRKLG